MNISIRPTKWIDHFKEVCFKTADYKKFNLWFVIVSSDIQVSARAFGFRVVEFLSQNKPTLTDIFETPFGRIFFVGAPNLALSRASKSLKQQAGFRFLFCLLFGQPAFKVRKAISGSR